MEFTKYNKLWFTISALLIIPGIIAIFVWGLNLGIDFKGGTVTAVKFNKTVGKSQVENSLKNLKLEDINIQPAKNNQYIIRTASTNDKLDEQISSSLKKVGENQVLNFESIGPSISSDLAKKAFGSIILASLGIIIYLAIAFRKVPKPANSWRFGLCAVAALIHDSLFVLGTYAILGHYFGYEVNSLFVTALLTIIGFSVHDTIVVFDRIRENLRLSPSNPFSHTANNSITQTLARSLNTSLTVIIVLLAMFLLGGETIKPFVLTLLLGIIIGTYSSIFNATPLLVIWQNAIDRKTDAAKAT
ncbi:MAG: protein translocase subunit SecF [bacterium]|nr:protein translocase subunit SecF [bacterium]